MNRRSGASSLLQRASSQLSGKKTTTSQSLGRSRDFMEDSDEEIDKYLSTIGKSGQKKITTLDDISISSSDNSFEEQRNVSKKMSDSGGGSKFLKKSAAKIVTKEAEAPSGDSKFLKKPSNNNTLNSTGGLNYSLDQRNVSSALNKVANLSSKYSKKDSQTKKPSKAQLSDSDLDLEMSQDSDVVADVKAMKSGKLGNTYPSNKPVTQERPKTAGMGRFMKSAKSNMQSSDDESEPKGGSRFLKKSSQSVPQVLNLQQENSESESIATESEPSFAPGKSFMKKGAVQNVKDLGPKTSTPNNKTKGIPIKPVKEASMALDTDEEDLAQFIQGLSPSSVSDENTEPIQERNIVAVVSDSESESFNQGKNFVKPKPTVWKKADSVSERVSTESVSSVESFGGAGVQLMNIDSLKSVSEDESPHSLMQSLSVVSSVHSDSGQEEVKQNYKNVLGQFGLSTLDDLAMEESPSPPQQVETSKPEPKPRQSKSNQKKKSPPTSLFSKVGLFTLDDLEEVDDDVSSIPSPDTARESPSGHVEDKYASDFESAPIETPRPESVATVASISEIKTASPTKSHYSEDFDDLSKTESVSSSSSRSKSEALSPSDSVETVKSIQDSVSEVSKSKSKSYNEEHSTDSEYSKTSRVSRSSRSSSTRTDGSFVSETYSSSYSKSVSVSPKKTKPKPDAAMISVEVQTSEDPGLKYAWNSTFTGQAIGGAQLGLGYVDPTPIATHAVSADALEAMTAYSPAAVALNDMLRQQINLTRNFMEIQQRSYQSAMESIQPSYAYTTLEETKRYIKKKRKPRLTFKDALKQVKEEMGL